MEEWRDIKDYEGLYQVSNEGRVKSLERTVIRNKGFKRLVKERILIPQKRGYYYLSVALCKKGKCIMKQVHRLVAEAFIPNPNNLPEVNHKDETPTNNSVENLEWCSHFYNMNYGTRRQRQTAKMVNHPTMSKKVDQIDVQTGEVVRQWKSTCECGRNGFKSSNVSACARGEIKQYKGYIWKYPM